MDEPHEDAPLLLAVAARIAFPDGSMGVPGLRKERDRGRLAVERIAGRDYTTLRAIRTMREQCRVQPRDHACNSEPTPERGSSGTATSAGLQATLERIVGERKKPSGTTSPKSTARRSGTVIPLASRS